MSKEQGIVVASSAQIHTALRAELRQLHGTGIARNFDSLAHAMDEMNMWNYAFNQAKVVAQLHAFSCRDSAIIHKYTFGDTK